MNADHLPESELRDRIEAAKMKVAIGGRYAHYKHPELTYSVTDLAIWEATDEVAVLYQAEYGERIQYARALSVWLETVDWDGKTVPRFTKVSDT